jgi:hypothetical protein
MAMGNQRGAFGESRNSTRSVAKAVEMGGAITMPTLARLLELLVEKTNYPHHIEVAITTGGLVKTLDNERDALETIRRLEAAPVAEKT